MYIGHRSKYHRYRKSCFPPMFPYILMTVVLFFLILNVYREPWAGNRSFKSHTTEPGCNSGDNQYGFVDFAFTAENYIIMGLPCAFCESANIS